MLLRALVAAEDKMLYGRLSSLLKLADVLIEETGRRRPSLRELMSHNVDLILLQHDYARSIVSTMRKLKQERDSPCVVVVTDKENPDERADLLAAGCDAVLYLGLSDESLRGALEGIIKRRTEVASLISSEAEPFRPQLADFASESAAMKALVDMAERVVESDTSLLILGETGVGKEWLARAIHGKSKRSRESFVAVNCAALPEQLLESELFGHEAGSYTGAIRARRGAFEMAHRGTIFLDEIGEMPIHLQVKLLRVLQDHCIQRVGAEKPFALDVRVIAASNRDLKALLEAKSFRQDLFYRLSVVTLTVPPLRERREDILTIADGYFQLFRQRIGRHIEGLSEGALTAIKMYDWPGNVRELINVIERAVLLCQQRVITTEHLPVSVVQSSAASWNIATSTDGGKVFRLVEDWQHKPFSEVKTRLVAELEREYLSALLSETQGGIGRTAELAGLNVKSLYSMMRRHGLRKEDFRKG